jgi:hypothetical protein
MYNQAIIIPGCEITGFIGVFSGEPGCMGNVFPFIVEVMPALGVLLPFLQIAAGGFGCTPPSFVTAHRFEAPRPNPVSS